MYTRDLEYNNGSDRYSNVTQEFDVRFNDRTIIVLIIYGTMLESVFVCVCIFVSLYNGFGAGIRGNCSSE